VLIIHRSKKGRKPNTKSKPEIRFEDQIGHQIKSRIVVVGKCGGFSRVPYIEAKP
jgi:hypothetical protein